MTLISSTRHILTISLLLFGSFLIFNTCTEEKLTEADGPSGGNPDLITSTIGHNGGELKTEDFSLTVPAGSFNSDVELSLSISENESPFGESSVTSIYRVEGIPEEFNNSITVAVKYNGTLLDSSYLAIGEPLGGSDIEDIYFLIPAVDSSGYLVGNLAASDYPKNYLFKNNVTNTELEDLIIGLKGIGSYSNSLFRINYPKYISENSIIDFSHLTIDCSSVIGTDFKFIKLANLFFKPAPIIIRDYKDYRVTRNGNCFNVDVDLIGPSKESLAKIKFASSLFSSVSYNLYDSDSFLSQIFMTNALILYLEDCLGYTTNNDPPSGIGGEPTDIKGGELWGLVGNELSFFDGFKDGDYPGFSSVIKYLVNFQNYDVGNFGEIFEEANTKNTNHYYSLISRVDTFIVDWFPDYYEKYIKGEVYNIESSVFLDQENIGIFKTSSDTSLVFKDNYNDLSAKRYIVELNNEFEDESTSLFLDAYPSNAANNDGVSTLVFKVDANDNLQHIVTARAEPVEIPNLKGYYQNGTKKFLVVVVNCINNGVDYTGATNIELLAEIKKEMTSPDPTTCEVSMKFYGKTHEVSDFFNNDLLDKDTTYWHNYNFEFSDSYSEGNFSGNTFSYEYVKEIGGYKYDIHFTLTLSSDKNEIASMIYTNTTSSSGNAGTSISNMIYHLESIPLENLDVANQEATYYVGEEEMCNSITEVSYSFDHETFDVFSNSKNLVEFTCNDISYVRIIVK